MMKTTKNLTLCIMTVVMLMLQLASPARVRADGETPPPSPTDVAAITPVPAETGTPGPAQQDTSESSMETPVEAGTPFPTPADTLEPTADPAQENIPEATPPTATQTSSNEHITLFEAARAIAGGANVVVLDEHGRSLPLASREAAQVIANSDPVWCPAGQAPTPGTNGCTTSYATLADLVANEGGNIAADGTIWITSGPVPEAGQVTLDGSMYSTWSNYALTLQGGWSGTNGDPNIGSNSVFSVPVQILHWNNSIVINNVSIENVVTSGVDWLKLQTNTGDITINNSSISNDSNTSNITAGVRLYAPDHVTIDNSNFNNNAGSNTITSANLTINNSNYTNIQNAYATLTYVALIDCSPETLSNLIISNSNFNNNGDGPGFNLAPTCIAENDQYDLDITIDNSSFNNNHSGLS